MRVLLSDDHPMFRAGLKALLEKESVYHVVGEAKDGYEALELTEKLHPDIVVLDISMPGISGLETAEHMRDSFPDTLIVMLSRHADSTIVDKALKAGAAAYVHKDAAFDELVMALDAVVRGRRYLSPAVLGPVVNHYIRTPAREGALHQYDSLTAREKEVFTLLSQGRSRSAIAETLNISPKTVDRHRSNILEKLELENNEEVATFAEAVGITE